MRSSLIVLIVCVSLAAPAAAQVPARVPIQGTLYDLAGDPIDGVLAVDFTLYADPAGAEGLWSDTMDVSFVGGIFTAYLGAGDPIDPIIFAQHPQVFVDEAVAATEGHYAEPEHGHGWTELSGIPAGFADGVDDDTNAWSDLTGVPAGFADGVDHDSQLSESQVDDYVSNNGFATRGLAVTTNSCTRYPSTGYLNDWDLPLNASCPAGQVLNGLTSYHDNGKEDRRWAYYCCTLRISP